MLGARRVARDSSSLERPTRLSRSKPRNCPPVFGFTDRRPDGAGRHTRGSPLTREPRGPAPHEHPPGVGHGLETSSSRRRLPRWVRAGRKYCVGCGQGLVQERSGRCAAGSGPRGTLCPQDLRHRAEKRFAPSSTGDGRRGDDEAVVGRTRRRRGAHRSGRRGSHSFRGARLLQVGFTNREGTDAADGILANSVAAMPAPEHRLNRPSASLPGSRA